ncbi:hypothetical protein D9M72_579980 [compost metagenome]
MGPLHRLRRRQRIVEPHTDQLWPRCNEPGDFASRGLREQTGDREIMAVQIVSAGCDERGEIRIAAEVGDCRDPRVERSQEVGKGGAHRDPGHADARGVDVVTH